MAFACKFLFSGHGEHVGKGLPSNRHPHPISHDRAGEIPVVRPDLLLEAFGAVDGAAHILVAVVAQPVVPGIDVRRYPGFFIAAVEGRPFREAVAEFGRYAAGVDKTVVNHQHAQRKRKAVAFEKEQGRLVVHLVEKRVLTFAHEGIMLRTVSQEFFELPVAGQWMDADFGQIRRQLGGKSAVFINIHLDEGFEVALFGGLAAAVGDLPGVVAAVGHDGQAVVFALRGTGFKYVDYLEDDTFLFRGDHGWEGLNEESCLRPDWTNILKYKITSN